MASVALGQTKFGSLGRSVRFVLNACGRLWDVSCRCRAEQALGVSWPGKNWRQLPPRTGRGWPGSHSTNRVSLSSKFPGERGQTAPNGNSFMESEPCRVAGDGCAEDVACHFASTADDISA